jgi:SAM-dependent methyltransferase
LNVIDSTENGRRLRILVAIASFGEKNIEFLRRIIRNYRGMAMDVDVVVLSEAPKELGPEVEVIVGLPSKNPWSLPFAHKAIFAQRLDHYDLFVYSEDDMEVTEDNLRAFLQVTPQLAPDEIAGYLRYEADASGNRFLPDVHGSFHWKPELVRRRGDQMVAEFTNEHAGFYVLTQAQLRRAIVSGGFLRGPHRGRYSWPETAATDAYTNCGFRKVVCLSRVDDFFIHHMSNRYVGQTGIPLSSFREHVQTLIDICNGVHPASTLCEVESKVPELMWSKRYDESLSRDLSGMVPPATKTVLSVGCGQGDAEVALRARGCSVTALPLDSVVGAAAARLGIEVVYGTLEECLEKMRERKFDCVLLTNLLHLLPDPWRILGECARLVREDGTLVIAGPNFYSIPILIKRALGWGDYKKLGGFAQSRINLHSMTAVKRQIESAGLSVSASRRINFNPPRNLTQTRRWLRRFTPRDWIIQARRCDSR